MRDRLKSVRFSRNIRNITFCLSLIFFVEFVFLFYHWLWQGHRFLIQALVFLVLGTAAGLAAVHFHGRFRMRN